MKAHRHRVLGLAASVWARKFAEYLHIPNEDRQQCAFDRASDVVAAVPPRGRVILLLDYGGTLFPLVRVPQLAAPDRPLLRLLDVLASRPGLEVHIVSGRSHTVLEHWLGKSSVHLHAEHGAMSRAAGQDSWLIHDPHAAAGDWQKVVRALLSDFVAAAPGSFLDEKTFSVAWDFRLVESSQGERLAKELIRQGEDTFSARSLEVVRGKRTVEIRPKGINKGTVVQRIRAQLAEPAVFVAIGDDTSDNDMFRALRHADLSVGVGETPQAPRHRLRDSVEVRLLLEALAKRKT